MSQADQNRRRFPRLQDPPVDGRMMVDGEARLVDISLGGMCLEGADAPRPRCRLRVSIPSSPRELHLLGTGIWNRLTATSQGPDGEVQPVYRGGLEFDRDRNPGTSSELELSRFIALNALESRRSGKYKRYALRPEVGTVKVETRYELRIRTISACGMLAETDPLAEPSSPLALMLRLPWGQLRLSGRLVQRETVLDDQQKPRSRLAIEFDELGAHERNQLEGLVAEGLGRNSRGSDEPAGPTLQ